MQINSRGHRSSFLRVAASSNFAFVWDSLRSPHNSTLAVMTEPAQVVMGASAGFINLSPHGFRKWARQYRQCERDFRTPVGFTPVPYFLLCRAIEFEADKPNRKWVADFT